MITRAAELALLALAHFREEGRGGTRLEPVRRKLNAILSHTTLQELSGRQPEATVSSAARSARSRA